MTDLSLFCSCVSQATASVKTCQLIGFEQLWQFVLVEHQLRNTCAALDDKWFIVIIDDYTNLVTIAAINRAFDNICVKPL